MSLDSHFRLKGGEDGNPGLVTVNQVNSVLREGVGEFGGN